MKFLLHLSVIGLLILSACSELEAQTSVLDIPIEPTEVKEKAPDLIIVGEGGTSKALFSLAAKTHQKEHGGEIYEIHNGDEFIQIMKDFVAKHGAVNHLEYFGHGNDTGLFVNQEPGIHGGIYAYDPESLASFPAGSIYELPRDTFTSGGTITFNGCNVAKGYPEYTSLAQSFANHFSVDATAPLGPTEFSFDPNGKSVLTEVKYLEPGYTGDMYMLPTYETKAFVTLEPQPTQIFTDLHEGQSYFESVKELVQLGLHLDDSEYFAPYKNITGEEAYQFCKVAFGESCVPDDEPDQWIRNLYAMKMLMDAAGMELTNGQTWHEPYIRWLDEQKLLYADFTSRKWYTRGEMAELTWGIMQAI